MNIPKTQLAFGYERGKFEVLKYEDYPVHTPKHNQVLLKVEAAGLCMSDIHTLMAQDAKFPSKFILGHEIAGQIVKVGDNLVGDPKYELGSRFSLTICNPCGRCKYCKSGRDNTCEETMAYGITRDGGFQQYLLIDNLNTLLPIPEGVSYEEAAVASDSVLTPLHAINKAKDVLDPTAKVLVFGLGGLGLNAIQLLSNFGCRIVACDVKEDLKDQAIKYGAHEFYTEISDSEHKEESFDVCFDFVGISQTFASCQRFVARYGKIVIVGLGSLKLNYYNFHMARKEITIYANFGGTAAEHLKCNEWLKSGAVKPSITIAKFEELPHYFNELANGNVTGRIVFRNNQLTKSNL